MNPAKQAELIQENAQELRRLHERVHETFKRKHENEEKKREWRDACAAFHAHYNRLSFPCGYEGALERIAAGDQATIDAAITFLEVRPYFFRSGYMWKDLLRKCRRAPKSQEQAERFAAVEEKVHAWKESKRPSNTRQTS